MREKENPDHPVAHHCEPHADGAESQSQGKNVAEADPYNPHRKKRDDHREFCVTGRAERVRKGK